MFDENTMDFIGYVTRNRSPLSGYFWQKDTKSTLAFDEHNFGRQFDDADKLSSQTDIYIGIGGVNGLRSGKRRASADSVVQFPGLFIDIDVGEPSGCAHVQTALPATPDEALDFIRSLALQPSWINFSGYGYHCYWWVRETNCSDPSKRAEFQTELMRASAEVLHLAEGRGWKLDNVSDLARITRVPGSRNHKRGPDALVEVEVFERDGPEYACLHDLKFCDLPQRLTKPVPSASRMIRTAPAPSAQAQTLNLANVDFMWNEATAAAKDGEGVPPGPNFAAVAQGCRFVGDALSQVSRLPEPEWFTLLGIAGRCHGGDKLAHVISSQDSRYDHSETATKLEQAVSYDVNCGKVAERHPGACDGCAFRDLVHRPVELGKYGRSLVGLCASYAFDPSDKLFVDLERPGRAVCPSAFDLQNLPQKRSSEVVLKTGLVRRISRRDYSPREDRFIPDRNMWVYNSYQAPDLIKQRDEDIETLFLAHLLFICNGDEAAAQHLLCYLAYLVQVAEKIAHAVLVQSGQGVGKSLLARLMSSVFGCGNFITERFEKVNAKFAEHISNRQLLVVEELQSEKREAYNAIKTLITEEFGSFEPKGKAVRQARNPFGILIFTNIDVPILLEEGDRRFYVIQGPKAAKEPAYYETFARTVGANPGAVRALLMSVDLSGFDAKAPPPVTAAKTALVAASIGSVEAVILDAVDQYDGPARRDVTTLQEWEKYLRDRLGRTCPVQSLTGIMKKLGFVQHPHQVRVDHGARPDGPARPRLWIIRNAEKLAGDLEALKKAYEAHEPYVQAAVYHAGYIDRLRARGTA